MRRIPRGIAPTMTIMVAHHGAAFVVAGPVAAGMFTFFPGEIGCAVSFGTCQDVVLIRLVAPAFNQHAILIKWRPLDQVWTDVQLVQVTGDQIALGIVPGSLANSVPGRDAAPFGHLRGKIGPPGSAFRARCRRQL